MTGLDCIGWVGRVGKRGYKKNINITIISDYFTE